MKILVPEKIQKEALDQLRSRGFEVDEKQGLSVDELSQIIGEYDALIVRSATKVTADLLKNATKLKVVGRAGTGVDNIDVDACTKQNILVINTPNANTNAAAELTIGLIFDVMKNISKAHHLGKNKDYRRATFVGSEVDGKTLGVIGFGRIAKNVSKKMKALGMNVVAYSPSMTDELAKKEGVQGVADIKEVLKRADVLTIHAPKNKETMHLIDKEALSLCKDGVYIVNVARGGIIEEQALCEALKSGKVKACACDVLEVEPKFTLTPEEQTYSNPLFEYEQFIYTPHLGASTLEASKRVGFGITEVVADALEGKEVQALNGTVIKA